MNSLRSALVIVVVGLAVSVVSAQSGGLTVRVSDTTGLPLPDATVTISHETGYVRQTTVRTGPNGLAEFPVLRPGRGYVVYVASSGLGTRRFTDIHITIGGNPSLDVQLTGQVDEQVKAVAGGNVVDLDDTAQTTRFSDEFMQDLPLAGRFYQNLLTLAPGMQDADGDGNPNVHGSREKDFKAIVSGVSNVDPLTGQQMSQVNPSSIEELEVIAAGAGVEFGGAQGGFARILQKQGSNELEGVFDLYYRSSKLDGEGVAGPSVLPEPEFDGYQPSLQLSGPIVKDKLWYRLSLEWIEREIPINVTSGIVVMTDDQEVHADQLTWQASPRNKLAYQFQSDPREIGNFGVDSTTPAGSAQRIDRTSDTHSVTWTASLSPRALVESQVAWQDLNSRILPATRGTSNDCARGDPLLEQAYCFNLDTGLASGPYYRTLDDHRQRLTVRSQAEVFGGRLWGASHQLKVGFLTENERYSRLLERKPDLFRTILRPGGIGDTKYFLYMRAGLPPGQNARATGTSWGLYIEDLIRPRRNVSLRVGLRLDREEIDADGFTPFDPAEEAARFNELAGFYPNAPQANFAARESFTAYEGLNEFIVALAELVGESPAAILPLLPSSTQQTLFWKNRRRKQSIALANTNLSPAIAVSWDPWNDAKTRLAFTARRYYDRIDLNLPLAELEPVTTDLLFEGEVPPGTRLGPFQVPELEFIFNPSVNIARIDRDLTTPHQDEFTFSVEREVAAETSVGLSYINRNYRDQIQDTDVNHAPGDFGRCRPPTLDYAAAHQFGAASRIEPVQVGDPDYDERYAPGDGIIDDCGGRIVFPDCGITGCETPFGLPHFDLPDGIPDLYVQNPGWGDIYLIGNFNRIDYEAYVLALTRRQHHGWGMQLSYTWSETRGDAAEFDPLAGDDRSLQQDEPGFQSHDRRHEVKLNAATVLPGGVRLGTAVSWQSGLPYSVLNQEVSVQPVSPQYLNFGSSALGRVRQQFVVGRNEPRNDSYWNVDVRLAKEMSLGSSVSMQVSVEVFNLLNDDTYFIDQQINGTNSAFRRFGRHWQLGLKLAF